MGSLVGSQDTWASPHPHVQCPWTHPHLQLTGRDTENGGSQAWGEANDAALLTGEAWLAPL